MMRTKHVILQLFAAVIFVAEANSYDFVGVSDEEVCIDATTEKHGWKKWADCSQGNCGGGVSDIQTQNAISEAKARQLDCPLLLFQTTFFDEFNSALQACKDTPWNNCKGSRNLYGGSWEAGEFQNRKLHGHGAEFITYEGSAYVGAFWRGMRHGKGVLWNKDFSERYVGDFAYDSRHGDGALEFANGNKYSGQFLAGNPHGLGTLTLADGSSKFGQWKNGKFASEVSAVMEPETVTPAPISPEQNQSEYNNSTEIISVSSGSGFVVSEDGYLVTNNHVIEGCQKVYVHRKGRKYETDIVSYDTQNDLALLKGNFQPDVVLPLTSAKPQLAQDIYVSGYPFGLNISSSVKVTKGIISSLTGIGNNLAEMQIDAALQSGNSGGPILDEYGNVVGVAVAKLDVKFALENFGAIPENTNFGVKANIVEALLDANGVNYQQGKAEKPSGAEFSNMLSNGTYYISCWMTLAQIEAMKTKKVMFSDLQ